MANGQNGQTGQNLSTAPYPGAPSDQEWLRGAGVPDASGRTAPGTTPAVQPPPAAGWYPTDPNAILNRYVGAGARGTAETAPILAGEAIAAPFTGGTTAAMMPETAALGFVGGVASQGAEDAWRGITGEEAPWYVGPTAGTIASLGVGGLPAAARGLRAGASYVSNMAHGGGFLGGLVGGGLADQILHNATHVITSMGGGAVTGLGLTAGTLASVRQMARPTLRSWLRPVAGALGGNVIPNAVNALSPSDYNTP